MTQSNVLSFQKNPLEIIKDDDGLWIRSPQIGYALGYKQPRQKMAQLYENNKREFTSSMTKEMKIKTNSGIQNTRVFSLRGVHLIAMFAKTAIAAEFREWVLNVLENHVSNTQKSPTAGLVENVTSTLKSVLRANEIAMKKRETSNHLQQASEDMAKDYAKDAGSLKGMRENIELEITNILIMNSVQIEILLEGGSSLDAPNPSIHDFLERTSRHLSRR
jgi:prophage antirepressor-like protein